MDITIPIDPLQSSRDWMNSLRIVGTDVRLYDRRATRDVAVVYISATRKVCQYYANLQDNKTYEPLRSRPFDRKHDADMEYARICAAYQANGYKWIKSVSSEDMEEKVARPAFVANVARHNPPRSETLARFEDHDTAANWAQARRSEVCQPYDTQEKLDTYWRQKKRHAMMKLYKNQRDVSIITKLARDSARFLDNAESEFVRRYNPETHAEDEAHMDRIRLKVQKDNRVYRRQIPALELEIKSIQLYMMSVEKKVETCSHEHNLVNPSHVNPFDYSPFTR